MSVPPMYPRGPASLTASRRRRRSAAFAIGILLLALAGCTTLVSGAASPALSNRTENSPTSEERTTEGRTTEEADETTTPPAPPAPTTADTGLSSATVGVPEGFVSSAGDQVMTFTVDAIALNPGCNSSIADPPANGNFVAVSITINILALVDGESPLWFSSPEWHIIGPNGVRDNDNSTLETYFCTTDSEQLPSGPLGVGTYVGLVVLDTPHTTGQVIWTPGELGGLEGWSWNY